MEVEPGVIFNLEGKYIRLDVRNARWLANCLVLIACSKEPGPAVALAMNRIGYDFSAYAPASLLATAHLIYVMVYGISRSAEDNAYRSYLEALSRRLTLAGEVVDAAWFQHNLAPRAIAGESAMIRLIAQVYRFMEMSPN